MGEIVFPNFAPLVGLMQQDNQNRLLDERERRQNAILADRERRLTKAEDDDAAAQQYIPGALNGDDTALAKLPGKYQLQVHQLRTQLDDKQRARVKGAIDWQTKALGSILTAPDDQRQAALDAAFAEGEALGYGPYLKNIPRQYTPAMAGLLQYHAAKTPELLRYLEQQPTPMGPVGGAAPGAPTAAIPPGVQANAQGGDIDRASKASAGIESGGRYDALGPMTGGDRAYGKYQVMGANIPQWTQLYYGQTLTPQQFLANPDAQEAVFKGKFGEYMRKYGPEGAARAWFAGEGGMNNPNAKDVLGTTVAGYAGKFSNAYGVGSAAGTAPPAFAANAVAPAPMEGMPQFAPAPGNVPLSDRPMPQGADPVLQMLAARSQQGAPMPGGFTPAQAPGGLPAAGLPPASEVKFLQQYVPPGYRMAGVQGMPHYDKQGRLGIFPVGATRRDQIEWIDVPKPGENKGPAGPFGGTGAEVQAFNLLVTSGKMTAEQAANVLGGKTITNPADGSIVFVPAATLAGVGGGAPPGIPAGGAPAAAAGIPAGGQAPAIPAGAPPGTVPITPPKSGIMPKEQADLRAARAEADRLKQAADVFISKWKEAGPMDWAKSMAGSNTPLNTAYNNFALLAKGDALYKLGVLNGPDLEIIRRIIPDPSQIKSGLVSEADMKASVQQVMDIIENGIRAQEKQLGVTSAPPEVAKGSGADGPRLSPEEAEKLPPGTRFIGMDGVPRTRN